MVDIATIPSDGFEFWRDASRDVWLDDVNGSDSNTGLAQGVAVKTWAKAVSLIGKLVDAEVVLHVADHGGAGYDYSTAPLGHLLLSKRIVIIGDGNGNGTTGDIESNLSVLASGTCQAGTGAGKVVTAGGMTVDEHVGLTVGVSFAGDEVRRTLRYNSVTDLEVGEPFAGSGVPSSGDAWRVFKPTPTLTMNMDGLAQELVSLPVYGSDAVGTQGGLVLVNLNLKTVAGSGFTAAQVFRGGLIWVHGCTWDASSTYVEASLDSCVFLAGQTNLSGSEKAQLALDLGLAAHRSDWHGWGMGSVGTNGVLVSARKGRIAGTIAVKGTLDFGDAWVLLSGGAFVFLSSFVPVVSSATSRPGGFLYALASRIENTGTKAALSLLEPCRARVQLCWIKSVGGVALDVGPGAVVELTAPDADHTSESTGGYGVQINGGRVDYSPGASHIGGSPSPAWIVDGFAFDPAELATAGDYIRGSEGGIIRRAV